VADQALDLRALRDVLAKTVTVRGEAAAGGGSNDHPRDGTATALQRRSQRAAREQHARRSLPACTDDSRCAIRVARSRTQARPAQHLDQSNQTTAWTERSGGGAGQQECPRHLGPLGSRRRLPHPSRGVTRRGENTCRRLSLALDGEPVRPAVSKPALKLGPLEATRVMRRKRADFHQGPERVTTLRFKAGYMTATGFSSADLQPCARAGSI